MQYVDILFINKGFAKVHPNSLSPLKSMFRSLCEHVLHYTI